MKRNHGLIVFYNITLAEMNENQSQHNFCHIVIATKIIVLTNSVERRDINWHIQERTRFVRIKN